MTELIVVREPQNEVSVTKTVNQVVSRPVSNEVVMASPGPQGPPGPAGPAGAAGGSVLIFTQASPSASWAITHNLNRLVFVTVVDSLGRELLAEIDQSDPNTVSITFATPTSGKAVVS